MSKLLNEEAHFAFGENWQSFLGVLDQDRIAEAVRGLERLLPGELRGASFLDVGSGSGLSSLAAHQLGARRIVSVDIDRNSVSATEALRRQAAPKAKWSVAHRSVFDLSPATDGKFDVVYSWGVLHHTGAMWDAIVKASDLVKPGGLFAVALYRRNTLCGAWRVEKRIYSRSPKWIQAILRGLYKAAWVTNEWRHGRDLQDKIRNYKSSRGMDWAHDVHDWMGGYPYESVRAEDVRAFMAARGFELAREFVTPPGLGVWGSGCDEFVFRRS